MARRKEFVTKYLVALDLDGTVLNHGSLGQHDDGTLAIEEQLQAAITRLHQEGHEVVIATGRSVDATLPVVEALGITPTWVIAANGAVTLKRDVLAHRAYRREHVESFDPRQLLTTIRPQLAGARYAIESAEGTFYYTEPIPAGTLPSKQVRVDFDELLSVPASRVIVVSPNHRLEEFVEAASTAGLKNVSYSVGTATWLDIAPIGVSKASALERVRQHEDLSLGRVFAAGDGSNDIEMLDWAGQYGEAIVMGQADERVKRHATKVTGTIDENGLLSALLDTFPHLATR